MADMQVELVAVERALWSGRAELVVARTVDGDVGVMPGHSPLLAALKEGYSARIREPDGSIFGIAVHGGFISVTDAGVTILAESAEMESEIDIQRAREEYERARSIGTDSAEAQAKLRHARSQLLAVGQDI